VSTPRPGLPVEIEYRRAGGETVVYRQRLVEVTPGAVVTLMESTPLPGPKRIGGRVVLEPGSPVVWFTFEGAWHDIGAFHLADGTFTGWYANILTPVALHPPTRELWRWATTDLCLDVWYDRAGVTLLDQAELEAARASGALDPDTALQAEREAARLVEGVRNDEWPPALVGEWPLDRARRVALEVDDEGQSSSSSSR